MGNTKQYILRIRFLQKIAFLFFSLISFQMAVSQNDTVLLKAKIYNVNGMEFKMIYVKHGTFIMGNHADTLMSMYSSSYDGMFDRRREATVNDFFISETEITQELWTAVMKYNPSIHKGKNLPVENVSWNECNKFCRKLTKITGTEFRLPLEKEWEFAAYGNDTSRKYLYCGSDTLDVVGWYNENTCETHPVKQKKCNILGLYDMSGNVMEWVSDSYDTIFFPNYKRQINDKLLKDAYPKIRYRKRWKVAKGGGYDSPWDICIPGVTLKGDKGWKGGRLGFRIASSLTDQPR